MTRHIKQVVTIGGGTGSFAVLSGIKRIPGIEISAIVSMADDGGTNGMLRRDLGVLPPSDARQCLVALADESDPVREVLNYRFENGALAGHNLGSMILGVLTKTTGDITKALKIVSEILKINGKVIPVTLDPAELVIDLIDGTRLEGENVIDKANLETGVDKITYKKRVTLSKDAQEALLRADYIIICPGDFYTSIAPNLITLGFKEVLTKCSAKIIAVTNLGEANIENFKSTLESYLGRLINHLIPPDESLKSTQNITQNPNDKVKRSVIRHDPEKLASVIEKIIASGK